VDPTAPGSPPGCQHNVSAGACPVQSNEFLGGLAYDLKVYDVVDGVKTDELLHQENGMIMNKYVPAYTSPLLPGWTIGTQSIVPHGQWIGAVALDVEYLDQEDYEKDLANLKTIINPLIPVQPSSNPVPVELQGADVFQYSTIPIPTFDGFGPCEGWCVFPTDKLAFANTIEQPQITQVTKWVMRDGGAPLFGQVGINGTVGNLPFAQTQVITNEFERTFYLQELEGDVASNPSRLQYATRVNLNFRGIQWPHIEVNTLSKKPPSETLSCSSVADAFTTVTDIP